MQPLFSRHRLDLLNDLWPLALLHVNLNLREQKLLNKTPTGALVRKAHDTAAARRSDC